MSVFHLKYRPRKLKELDLEGVVASLKNILKGPEIPQSLLFSGPKGAGKTSAARIVARAVNCLKPEVGEPCGECGNCKEILSGNSIDVMEIDAASNRGIEEARSLKEKAVLSPSHLKWKVFIVDEVHMMTRDAFNALLKLIEEPPKNTIFILCTTDEEKIPETVLSRLIKVSFYKGGEKELKKSLGRVIEGEKVEIDDGAVALMLKKSDGSFRNLHKTFTEIYLEYGSKISEKQVKEFFDRKHGEYTIKDFEEDLINKDVKKILGSLEKMAEKGANFRNYREQLLQYFQVKLLSVYGIGEKTESALTGLQIDRWLQLLINAGKQEKEAVVDQLPLELAVVEFLEVGNGNLKRPEQSEPKANEKKIVEAEAKPKAAPADVAKSEDDQFEAGFGIDKVEESWGKILMAVKPYNHSVEAFLRAARPKTLKGRTLNLEVFYPFHKDKLEESKNRKIVEEGLRSVFGVDLRFECELSNGERKALIINNETPVNLVSGELTKGDAEGDIYDVAKQIFG